jgi:hypothetical protein
VRELQWDGTDWVRVNDIELKKVPTQVGMRIQLTITTDNIPARALLDRGEAFMLADAIRDLARTVVLP